MKSGIGNTTTQKAFFNCPICEQYHPKGFDGDCRDNQNRFSLSRLEDLGDWEEVFLEDEE